MGVMLRELAQLPETLRPGKIIAPLRPLSQREETLGPEYALSIHKNAEPPNLSWGPERRS